MGTKTKTNKRSPKMIIALCLALAMLAAVGVATYAWIRNYVGVAQVSLTTGRMAYKITLYQKDGDTYKAEKLFDTKDVSDAEKNLESFISDEKSQIDAIIGDEVFFVIEKYADSIDLDVSLAFEKDGTEKQYQYMGQATFQMMDDSKSFDTKFDSVIGDKTPEQIVESDITASVSNLAKDSAYKNQAKPENMNAIWETVQKTRSLDNNASYACIRLKFDKVDGASNDVIGETFPLNLKFCVAQKGAKDDNSGETHDVTRVEDIATLLESYGINDEIRITGVGTEAQPAVFNGDLVFTRPCKVILNRSYIQVNGNLIFSYAYDAQYSLDTISDGHLDVSGNFQIDLPNAGIDLLGANNAAEGKADVYVGGEFVANASKLETRGLNFKGMRVCNAGEETLKSLKINGDTRLTTALRSQIGKLTVENYGVGYGFGIVIDNLGSIEQIDFTNMIQNTNLRKTPCILIDNSGTITDPLILLPSWSEKFEQGDNGTADIEHDDTFKGNTKIIANKGSSKMYALSAYYTNKYGGWPENSTQIDTHFISNRDKTYGVDHIDYAVREDFIDVLESDAKGNPTSIVIHYEVPSEEAVSKNPGLAELVPTGTSTVSLCDYLDFYGYMTAKNGSIPITLLKDVKIICYGDKVLSGNGYDPDATGYKEDDHADDYLTDDYACIRAMSALETLDLSEAVSKSVVVTLRDPAINKNQDITETHKLVPEGAFRGMSSLSEIKMSEGDTAWGRNLFVGTSVDEVTFPQALVRLLNTRYTKAESSINHGKIKSQDVLTDIKYVYTSITNLKGLWSGENSKQYFFTPDEQTYNYYRSLNGLATWSSKIFMNNGVVRQGQNRDLFLRYDPEGTTCEFVTYAGNSPTWIDEFDFKTFSIGGETYDIVSYDPYALYGKLDSISKSVNLVLGEKLETIGAYAFASNSKITSVTFNGNTTLKGSCFKANSNTSLEEVTAPVLTTIEGGANFDGNNNLKTLNMPNLKYVTGDKDLNGCSKLERVDISVIEYTNSNKSFYPSSDSYTYAKFYIHTENLSEEEIKAIKKDDAKDGAFYEKALAADYRHIFVSLEYAGLYRANTTYTGVADIGDNQLADLKEITVDGISYNYYIYGETGSKTACLVACLTDEIDKSADASYTLISSITDATGTYNITKIGSAAYHFTAIIAKKLVVPSAVTELGDYAFDASRSAYPKRLGEFNLSNVKKAGNGTFKNVEMLSVIGMLLSEAGKDAFTDNKVLVYADLPVLAVSVTNNQTNTMFVNAEELRVAYLGISNKINYDNAWSRKNGYVRFVNVINTDANSNITSVNLSNVNTVINASDVTPKIGFYRNHVNIENYEGIYLSDYYDYTRTLEYTDSNKQKINMEVSVSLPGYVFYEPKDADGNLTGKLTLFAVSPDIELQSEYTTPETLYINGTDQSKNTVVDNGSSTKKPVDTIGKYAYGLVTMNDKVTTLKIGANTKTIGSSAFKGSAYLASNSTNTVLGDTVANADLMNVEIIEDNAFDEAKFVNLKADKVEYLGQTAFARCSKLTYVYLPMFKAAIGEEPFSGCTSLSEVTFGKFTESFPKNMFSGASSLTRINILREDLPVSLGDNPDSIVLVPKYASQVHVYVHGGAYQEYLDTYYYATGKTFGGISQNNLHKYGETVEHSGIRYYLNVIDGTSAYVDYVESITNTALPTDFTILAKLGAYDILGVSSSAIQSLTKVTKITLPASMKYMMFTAEDLPATVTALEISGDNGFFKTDSGVLYSKDGTTLYAYPKAKAATTFEINKVGSAITTVTQIFEEAFCNVANLQTLIINGEVTVNDRAFAGATALTNITFNSNTASTFAGWDILSGAYVDLKIYVPSANLNDYKANVLIDYSILGKFEGK